MLKLGSLAIDFPVTQAPLSGYSDLAMRRVARMHGAVYTLNEVVLDQTVLTRGKKQRSITALAEDDHPVGGQLMGADPASFALAADKLVEAGYDCVDINFGCPVRKVLGRCRGGFLLSQPKKALEIVRPLAGRFMISQSRNCPQPPRLTVPVPMPPRGKAISSRLRPSKDC